MDSVIVIAPAPYDAEVQARLACLEADCAVGRTADGLVVSDGQSRLYVTRSVEVREELDVSRLEKIAALIPQPIFYVVDFSDVALCRRVLLVIADDAKILVDDDHGTLLPGDEFVRALRARPDWDWRVCT